MVLAIAQPQKKEYDIGEKIQKQQIPSARDTCDGSQDEILSVQTPGSTYVGRRADQLLLARKYFWFI
jgi:hypothetical protein